MAKTQKSKRQLRREQPPNKEMEDAIAAVEAAASDPETSGKDAVRPVISEPAKAPSRRKEIKSTASARRQREKATKGLAIRDKLEARVSRTEEKQTKRKNAKALW